MKQQKPIKKDVSDMQFTLDKYTFVQTMDGDQPRIHILRYGLEWTSIPEQYTMAWLYVMDKYVQAQHAVQNRQPLPVSYTGAAPRHEKSIQHQTTVHHGHAVLWDTGSMTVLVNGNEYRTCPYTARNAASALFEAISHLDNVLEGAYTHAYTTDTRLHHA